MKTGFFFIILAALVVAALISGCKAQTEPPKQPEQHDLFTEKGQSKNVTECSSGSDCGVGGCSGQVCATAEEAVGMITTCEYREEYGCLKLTSCGCVNGKCVWQQNTEYTACLDEAKSQPQPQQPQ